MSEIKVGEYVRSKNGALGKITKVVTEDIFYVKFYDNLEWKTDIEESGIIKHSSNIIDLIEVGDYINGDLVIWINRYVIHTEDIDYYKEKINEDIRTIVTHEQFKDVGYKVNE